ncbi:ABC transporter substrate-binding protein [Microbacterium luticocti]|uniref:ABC transporter substrate-binding protein n=1 Tax=Microbacterium luticocti TaxID=451764 RepID=UPI000406FC87|nr:ABC transporter substrate-binding protein [Microbacterium luticocti]
MFQLMNRRRRAARVSAVAAGVLAAALAFTGCSGSSTPTDTKAASGDIDPNATIEAGISYSLGGSFDPILASGAVTVAANWHIFEGLLDLDPVTHKPVLGLAAEMPKKVDDTTYEVTLRKDAKFSTGDPVTVDDVIYSIDRTMDADKSGFFASFVSFIDKAEKVDDSTVKITTKYPFSLFNERLAVVKVVPKALVEKNAEDFGAHPVGSGPYTLESAVPDDSLVFKKNPNYNGTRPAKAAGMKWDLLSDPAARVTAMQSGTIQAMEDVPYIDIDTLKNSGVDVKSEQSFGLLFMMFNQAVKPFDDVRVRQAFFYALDMDKIIKTGMLGNATAATSFLPKNNPGYHEASTVYTYDPQKAKDLLKAAGVNDLSITLLTTDTGWVKEVAPLVKESLDAVGIKTKLDIGQSPAQYQKVDSGDYQVLLAPGDPSVFGNDPDLLMNWWFGDNVWPTTRMHWADSPEYKQLTDLLNAAQRQSGDEQQATWNKAYDLIAEQVPMYPLFHRKLPTAWNSQKLVGFEPVNTTGLSFLDVGVAK